MPDVRTTENEFRGKVITWLNEQVRTGGTRLEQATEDPSIRTSRGERRLPDVQIWLNRKAQQGFCGWELKTPETPVDDPALLENAAEKARAMNADYFVTWNMRETVIWRTPPEGTPVSREHRAKTYPPIPQVTSVEDLWDRFKGGLLQARALDVLNDLATLSHDGHLHQIDTDTTFFVKLLTDAAHELHPDMEEALVKLDSQSSQFRAGLQEWAYRQCVANYGDPAFYEMVARQIVYRLLGKILFYHTLRRHFPKKLPPMELAETTPAAAQKHLGWFFQQAQQIDYQAVFLEDFPDQVPIPQAGFTILTKLLNDLDRYNFSRMPLDVIGKVFEQLIPPHERHALGQYFTPENLVDLIIAFCARQPTDYILDPTCGTGTFLIRAYDRLKIPGQRDHKTLLSQLWGVDVAPFPAELATINLYRQNLDDYVNVPKILARDIFEISQGQKFAFPLPKPTGGVSTTEIPMPAFDAIVGNFPFIRQELLNRHITGYKAKLEKLLAQEWGREFGKAGHVPEVSGQADIYVYLFFHIAKLLKEQGRMGIITSNAWLDVAYGYALQRFLLTHFKLIAVVESRCEPWFEESAVNTVFTILELCSSEHERNHNLVNFVQIKKRLKDLIPWDMQLEANVRWRNLDNMAMRITSAGRKLLKFEDGKVVSTLKGCQTFEEDDFRVRVFTQRELLEEVKKSGQTVKWGLYLRAPEVYFEIVKQAGDKLARLQKVADVRYGLKSGITEFFYLSEETIKHFGIEPDFVPPLLTSLKEVEEPLIDPKRLKVRLFKCHLSKSDLRARKKPGALAYIEDGERKTTTGEGRVGRKGVRYPDVPSVKGRALWYDVGDRKPGHVIINQFIGQRFFFPINPHRVMVTNTFFECQFHDEKNARLYAALMNSTFSYLVAELTGRITWAQGVLYFYGPEISELLLPHADRISKKASEQILDAFDKLIQRPIKTIFEEVKAKDRQTLDSAVLEALGVDPKRYLKPLYDGLCELVQQRLELSKARQKVKQVKVKRDEEKLKAQAVQELLPEGPKQFPEEFLDRSLRASDFHEIPVPGDPLRLDALGPLFPKVISDKGYSYQAKGHDEAKYVVYAQKPNAFIVKLPRQPFAITQAVNRYEQYLRKLRKSLFKTLCDRARDAKLADALTQRVFEELKLPEVPSE